MAELNDFLLTNSHSNANPTPSRPTTNGFPAARLEDAIDRYVDTLTLMLANSHPSSLRQGNPSPVPNVQTQSSDDEFTNAIESLKSSKIKIQELF